MCVKSAPKPGKCFELKHEPVYKLGYEFGQELFDFGLDLELGPELDWWIAKAWLEARQRLPEGLSRLGVRLPEPNGQLVKLG